MDPVIIDAVDGEKYRLVPISEADMIFPEHSNGARVFWTHRIEVVK